MNILVKFEILSDAKCHVGIASYVRGCLDGLKHMGVIIPRDTVYKLTVSGIDAADNKFIDKFIDKVYVAGDDVYSVDYTLEVSAAIEKKYFNETLQLEINVSTILRGVVADALDKTGGSLLRYEETDIVLQ